MSKLISVGQSMFDELRKNDIYYVDKTEILYELRGADKRDHVSLFTRPRRFGKTLMMSMMENFFNIAKDSRDVFEGLDIMNHPEFCEQYMNQYPVIFVSFKDAYGKDYNDAYTKFVDIIAKTCKGMVSIIDHEKIDPDERKIFYALKSKTASNAEVASSLDTLMSILYTVYGKKVILLIDEYDVPIARAFNTDENSYYPDMLGLMKEVLSYALKDNKYLEFGILTGCLRIAKQSIFTDVNNFTNYSVIDRKYSSYFGFTEDEVHDMLNSIGCEDKLPLVREWYDGYLFGTTHIYCPWDVVNYASELSEYKDAIPQNFWENTSSNDLLLKFVRQGYRYISDIGDNEDDIEEENHRLTKQFNALLEGKHIYIDIASNLTYDMVHSSIDNVWSILLMTGYLTPISLITDYNSVGVKLPNKEISNLFKSTIVSKFKKALDQKKHRGLVRSLWNKDASEATKYLSALLDDNISCFDYYENFYHAFLTGIFSGLGYRIKSNKEVGDGRADMIIQDDLDNRVMIIETKRTTDETKMDAMCDEAIQQIRDNRYDASYKDTYPTVLCYGITFYKKSAMVKLMPE